MGASGGCTVDQCPEQAHMPPHFCSMHSCSMQVDPEALYRNAVRSRRRCCHGCASCQIGLASIVLVAASGSGFKGISPHYAIALVFDNNACVINMISFSWNLPYDVVQLIRRTIHTEHPVQTPFRSVPAARLNVALVMVRHDSFKTGHSRPFSSNARRHLSVSLRPTNADCTPWRVNVCGISDSCMSLLGTRWHQRNLAVEIYFSATARMMPVRRWRART